MNRDDVDIIEKSNAFEGYFRVDRYCLRHRLHDGGTGPELVREVFERGHVAAVLPVDTARDEVVLVEQFRPGAFAAGWLPWLLECIAGVVEAGESTEAVVRREAREEAGCELAELLPIGRFLSSPGASSETVALYCGRTAAQGLGGVHGLREEGEDIKVHVLAVRDALALLDGGRILNAKTLVALHWLARRYPSLKQSWR